MSASNLARTPLDEWLENLAAPTPEPGGGAAAGLVVATGAALVAMAAGYATGAEREPILAAASAARRAALAEADHDGRLSAELVAAFRLPESDLTRPALIRETTVRAAEAGSVLVEIAESLAPGLTWLELRGEPRLAPDVAVAARMFACGIRSTSVNIRCNTTSAALAGVAQELLEGLRAAYGAANDTADRFDALAERVEATL